MASLIEQMNVLKGLRDEDLQAEASSPSGSAPPYLILTEISRRKNMRERYDGDKARQRQNSTVLEDLVAGAPAMPPAAMGGIDAAASAMPPVGFADGGIVDYADIAARLNERLSGLSGDADRARALALIAAGAGIMGGGSSNTLKNIGVGVGAGLNAYQSGIDTVDKREMDLLRSLTDIGQLQNAEELAGMDRGFRERELALQEARLAAEMQGGGAEPPADVRTTEWFLSQPKDVQDTFLKLNPPYNPNAVTGNERQSDDFNRIVENALKALPDPSFVEPGTEATVAAERLRQAQIIAYNQIRAAYGETAAEQFRAQAGLAVGDLVLGASPDGAVNAQDPLGLGL